VKAPSVPLSTIGLGKDVGASSLHGAGFEAMAEVLPEAARCVLGKLRVPFGVALLEDAWHRLRRAEVVPGDLILERDRALRGVASQGSRPIAYGCRPDGDVTLGRRTVLARCCRAPDRHRSQRLPCRLAAGGVPLVSPGTETRRHGA
jgi:hypothetical protein